MEKLLVEIGLGRGGFEKWRIGRKTRRQVREIKGSGILMNKEKKRGGVFVTAAPPPYSILFSIFVVANLISRR